MLNKLDEKDFILVRKLFVAPTQIRNRFSNVMRFVKRLYAAENTIMLPQIFKRNSFVWISAEMGIFFTGFDALPLSVEF